MDDELKSTSLEQRRTRNKRFIEASDSRYFFTSSSAVFHTRSCSLILNAHGITGCFNYETALKERRPCKICKPQPDPERDTQNEGTPDSHKHSKGTVVRAKLLDGKSVKISAREIVGYCHLEGHPGKVSKRILKEHQCLEKKCPFLERYNANPYWAELQKEEARKRKDKEVRKAEKRAKKAAAVT